MGSRSDLCGHKRTTTSRSVASADAAYWPEKEGQSKHRVERTGEETAAEKS